MSHWQWKWRRLRAMSLQEIVVRTARMLRERVAPLPKEPPEQTWQRLYPRHDPHAWLEQLSARLPLHPNAISEPERTRLLQEADALLQGRWQLFGYPVQLDDPPRWNRNYLLGKEWMDAPARQIDYRHTDVAGGVKYVWELSRHQPILRLAQAYALTGDPRYAQTCLRWWLDWIERNPRGWGIHWTSALEHAVRMFVWLYTLRLLQAAPSPQRVEAAKLLGAILQHGEYIERHLSLDSSANNHLIGEAAALAFAGALLPDCPTTRRWRQKGYAILEREAMRQFHPDGVNAEQAFGYLPFVWEFYLHGYRLQPMPDAVAERLRKSVEFVRNVMDASGYVPQVGDEDDGTVVPLWSEVGNRHRVVGRALAMALGCEPPPAFSESDDALCQWLSGRAAPPGSRLTESRLYPEGGYAVLYTATWQVLFDAGPLGLGSLAAHGHADALSVWASLNGKPLLIDAGTYAYHEDPDWRDYFRGTAAHNTVQMDNFNQSEILGAFLWGRKAHAYFEYIDLDTGVAEGSHDGYVPDWHIRTMHLHGDTLEVRDRWILDAGGTLTWHWHFHPHWVIQHVEHGWLASDGESACLITVEGLPADVEVHLVRGEGDTPSVGWYSPRFGHRIPCTTLRVRCHTGAFGVDEPTVVWRFHSRSHQSS